MLKYCIALVVASTVLSGCKQDNAQRQTSSGEQSSHQSEDTTGSLRPYISATGKGSGIGIDMGGGLYMDMNGNLNIGIGF